MRVTTLGGHAIKQYTSPNSGGTMTAHKGIVMHHAEGTYAGTISWQMNPDQKYSDGTSVNTCSTWVIGKNSGEWAQMVDTSAIAWCQRAGSRDWLSIEYAGYHTEALTAWQLEATALLLQWANRVHGIPIAIAHDPSERGLGHHSMDREWLGEEWGHEDCPGNLTINAKSKIIDLAKGVDDVLTAAQDAMLKDIASRVKYIDGRVEALESGSATIGAQFPTAGRSMELMKRVDELLNGVEEILTLLKTPAAGPTLAGSFTISGSGSVQSAPQS